MKIIKKQLKEIIKEELLQEGFLDALGNRYVDWVNKNIPPGPEAKAKSDAKREEVMQLVNQHIGDYAFLMYLERVLKESRWGGGSAN